MWTFPCCFLSAGLSWGASSCSVLLLPSCPLLLAKADPGQGAPGPSAEARTGATSPFIGSHEPSLEQLFRQMGAFELAPGLSCAMASPQPATEHRRGHPKLMSLQSLATSKSRAARATPGTQAEAASSPEPRYPPAWQSRASEKSGNKQRVGMVNSPAEG